MDYVAQRASDPVFRERQIDLRMCIRRSEEGHARQLLERVGEVAWLPTWYLYLYQQPVRIQPVRMPHMATAIIGDS